MAKKKHEEISGDQRLENIGETLSKTEEFIFNNQKLIGIGITIIIIAILGYFGYSKYYIEPKTTEAEEQMFQAQQYFEADSLDLVELIMQFEEEFGGEISDEDAQTIETVGQAVTYIQTHMG